MRVSIILLNPANQHQHHFMDAHTSLHVRLYPMDGNVLLLLTLLSRTPTTLCQHTCQRNWPL